MDLPNIPIKRGSNVSSESSETVNFLKLSQLDETVAKVALSNIISINRDFSRWVLKHYMHEDNILFAVQDKEIIGYVAFREDNRPNLKRHANKNHKNLYVAYLAVDPQAVKKGVATNLMLQIFGFAKARGARKVKLDFRLQSGLTDFYAKVSKKAQEAGFIEHIKEKIRPWDAHYLNNGNDKIRCTFYMT